MQDNCPGSTGQEALNSGHPGPGPDPHRPEGETGPEAQVQAMDTQIRPMAFTFQET